MTIDKSKVENILKTDDFHVNELRDLVEQRQLNVDKRFKDDMIEALLADKWTDEEFNDLKDRFLRIQRERSPMGFYIGKIEDLPDYTDQATHEELKETLLVDAADRDGVELNEEGFEIREATKNSVSGIYWTQTRTYTLNALRELTSRERTYDIGFEFDLEERIVHINADNYGKRGEILTKFAEKGIEIESVGPHGEKGGNANEIIEGFIEDVESGLQAAKEQQELHDFSDGSGRSLLQTRTLEIKLTDGQLKTANLEGHQDIFETDVVKELTEDENGRIIHLKGIFEYRGEDFNFHVGLPEELGRIRIKKKGAPKDNVDLLEDAFDFLFEHFNEHFIDC